MTAKVRSWVCRDTLTSVSHFTEPEEKQAFPNLLQSFELTPVLWSKTWNQDFFYSSVLIISCCTQGHGRVGCLQKGHWEYGSLVTVTGVSSSTTAQRAGDEEGSLPIWPEQPISWISSPLSYPVGIELDAAAVSQPAHLRLACLSW